jgi:hypothetical protein
MQKKINRENISLSVASTETTTFIRTVKTARVKFGVELSNEQTYNIRTNFYIG